MNGMATGREGIAKGNAGVGKCRGIDDDEGSFVAFRRMDALDERALGVVLEGPRTTTPAARPALDERRSMSARVTLP